MPNVQFALAGQGIEIDAAMIKGSTEAGVIASIHLLILRDDIPALMSALDVQAPSFFYG